MADEDDPPIRLLIIEDNVAHARFVRSVVEATGPRVEVHQAGRLASALGRLRSEPFDFVLTDMYLPDAQGATVVAEIVAIAPEVPVLVISALDDGAVAEETMAAGADDYLVKDQLTPALLAHALVRARRRATASRGGGAMVDAATGAFNRRGVEVATAKAVAFARRQRHSVTLLHLDIAGPATTVADVVRTAVDTARDSDFVGRLDGRRAVVVLPNDLSDPPAMLARLRLRLEERGLAEVQVWVEVRRFDPEHPTTADALLAVPTNEAVEPSGPQRRVLVVTDDDGLLADVRGVLGGWVLFEAAGAGPASRIAALEQPHVAVVDLDLGQGEGLRVARLIAEGTEVGGLAIIGVRRSGGSADGLTSRPLGVAAVVGRAELARELPHAIERAVR